jgi:hypothetical protein
MVINARFERRSNSTSPSNRAVLSRQIRADAQGSHFSEQDQISGGSAPVNHLASIDEATSGRMFGLHEERGETHATRNKKISRLWLSIRKAIAKRS